MRLYCTMTLSKKTLIIPLVAVGLLAGASSAMAYHGGGCWGWGDGYHHRGYYDGPRSCWDGRYHMRHGGPCWYYDGDERRSYDRDARDMDRPGPDDRYIDDRPDVRGDYPPPPPAGPELSPEERAQFAKIVDDFRAKADPLRDELFVREAELKALQNAPEPDVNAVSGKAKEVVKLRNQIKELRAQLVNDLEKAGF